MTERDWADRFGRDLDGVLDEARGIHSKPPPVEYVQTLDLARTLAGMDFSTESQIRQPLRRRLLNWLDASEKGEGQMGGLSVRTPFWPPRAVSSLAVIALTAVLVATLAWSGAMTATAQGIYDFAERIWLGEYTFAIPRADPSGAASTDQVSPAEPMVEQRGDVWILRTAIGNFAGNALPGRDPAVHRFTSTEEAQAASTFDLRQPAHLPTGYALREVIVTPLDWVFLFYDGPEGDIIVAQIPVGERSSSGDGEFVATTVGMLTDEHTVQVTMDGHSAGWLEGFGLVWEAGGISYTVGGTNLGLDEAMAIAESLS